MASKRNNIPEKASEIAYADIQLGAVYAFEKNITKEAVATFAKLTGDFNPLHTKRVFGNKSMFGKNIVHGMLAGSLCSTLVGMYCPGEKSLYISQTLQFKKPIYPGEVVRVIGTVVGKNDSIKFVTIKTDIIARGAIAITGTAVVRVLE